MDHHRFVVIGAGISGISFARFLDDNDVLVLEQENEIGGYCRTVKKEGFVWDYSGHFFHFKDPDLERFLVEQMPEQNIRVVSKRSFIRYGERTIDFPFQKNIHQLEHDDFVDCLYDLVFRDEEFDVDSPPANFKELLYRKFGRGITERFLVPYNEKLYACPLEELDVDAMGRFFPWADTREIIRNFRAPDNASYNATFTYPDGGAIEYVNAIASGIPDDTVALNERVISIDTRSRTLRTTVRELSFDHVISSAPFDRLLQLTGLEAAEGVLRSNKVLVFNLGFDRPGPRDIHWLYVPERDYRLYRVGFYSNIFDAERLSLYVEVGLQTDDVVDVDAERENVLNDLRKLGIIDKHEIAAEHHVVLDPAYVHITSESKEFVESTRNMLTTAGVHSVGRYGAWTYCSIEDNIQEARELATRFNRMDAASGRTS